MASEPKRETGITPAVARPVSELQLRRNFPTLRVVDVGLFLSALNAALTEFEIHSPVRIASWLAQVGHESAGLTRWVESFAYTPERLQQVFPHVFPTAAIARETLKGGVQTIAERVYGGRHDLGNTQPGDGYAYRGRGPLHLTGRANYREAGQALGLALEDHPDLVAGATIGFRVAAWWWREHGCNELADRGDFVGLTRRINGGLTGWDDRVSRWRAARLALGLPALAESEAAMASEFHVRDGLSFQRDGDGEVVVRWAGLSTMLTRLSASEWASVIAHVSARGGTRDAYDDARALHALGPKDAA